MPVSVCPRHQMLSNLIEAAFGRTDPPLNLRWSRLVHTVHVSVSHLNTQHPHLSHPAENFATFPPYQRKTSSTYAQSRNFSSRRLGGFNYRDWQRRGFIWAIVPHVVAVLWVHSR